MPTYVYTCGEHGAFEVTKPVTECSREEFCPDCGETARRVFLAVPDIWHTDGAHKTDYFSGNSAVGSKADQLRRKYERVTGEKAPPPAPDVPRNAKDFV